MPTDEQVARSPQSVVRVIRLIEALCAAAEPMSLAELARRLAAPKSSVAALLRGLCAEAFIVPVDGAWTLGPGAFGLGSALVEARRRLSNLDLVRDGMRRLAERCGETVLLGVRNEDGQTLTYVDIVESQKTVRFIAPVGGRRPLYSTAGGRALLAAEPAEAVLRYLQKLKPMALTTRTQVGKRQLAAAISVARAKGVAQTVGETSEGVSGTAAAIWDARSSVLGALIVAAPSPRLADRFTELASLVRDEASLISRTLGFR